MSILLSQRKTSKVKYYDLALSIQKKLIECLVVDFSPGAYTEAGKVKVTYWLYQKYRDLIFDSMQSIVNNITFAYSIYITNESEYYKRRNHFNSAIGSCESLLQHLTMSCNVLPIHAKMWGQFIEPIQDLVDLLKKARQRDNDTLRKIREGKTLNS